MARRGRSVWSCFALVLMLLGGTVFSAQASGLSSENDPLQSMRFLRYGNAEELPDQIVTALAEDRSGLIWVGSTVGLLRFDGYEFRLFSRTPDDPSTLPGNYIRALLVARDGRLWIGTEGDGAAMFDPATGRFTRVPVNDQTEPGRGGSVHAIVEASDGTIFIGSSSRGLVRVNPHTMASAFIGHSQGSSAAAGDLQVESLQFDARRNVLWIGTWNGLKRLQLGEPAYADVDPGNAPYSQAMRGNVLWSLLLDANRRLWAGAESGQVVMLDADSGALLRIVSEGSRSDDIRGAAQSLLLANEQEVWVGRGNGLERRRIADGSLLQTVSYSPDHPSGLAGNDIRALIQDRAGGVWLGGFGSGLMRYDTHAEAIHVVRDFGPGFEEGNINSVLALADGRVALGSASDGLLLVDQNFKPLRHFPAGKHGMLAGRIRGLALSEGDWIWVGGSSLLRLNLATGEIDPYGERYEFVGRDVRRLLRGPDGTLWIGSLSGLHAVPPSLDGLAPVPVDGLQDAAGLSINAMQVDAVGRLWVGALQGLYRFAPGDAALHRVVSPDGQGLIHHSVTGLLLDRQQRLWVDTAEGLHLGNDIGARLISFEQVSAGMGRSFGANLLQDANGRIWTHQYVYDPSKREVNELTLADGVDFGIGWFRAYDRMPDGRMLFGGSKGLLVVQPWRYQPWRYEPPVALTNVRVDGRVQLPLSDQAIVLQPGQRSFAVEFAALDYTQPGRNRYAYRLNGFEDDWTEVGAGQRQAGYNNLSPGRYVLSIRGSNRSGHFADTPLEVPVEVLPAWWQTPVSRLLQVVLAIGLVLLFIQARTAYLHRQRDALELKVQERTQELEKASRIKSDFLANMSHEIRTPMNAIIGMSRLCLETKLGQQQRDYVLKIRNASESLLGIINDILDLSKIEAGKLQLENAPFRLVEVIERVADLVSSRAEEKSLALVLPNVSPDLVLVGDSLRLGQVLWNLAGNAVKFTKRGQVVLAVETLSAEQPHHVRLRFSIRDSGIGMSPAQVESLFKPFQQADSSTSRLYGGTGLGLAISQRLVRAMGGTIEVESRIDRGSEFFFTLAFELAAADALPAKEDETKPVWESAAAQALRGKRVLVVDDVDVNRQVASEWLRRAGVEVVLASDGEQAVEQVRGSRFDAVLMDVQMPGMDGYSATREIRRIGQLSLPIIAMTANAMAEDRRQCLEAGMDDHLGKPVQPERMFASLAEWVAARVADQQSGDSAEPSNWPYKAVLSAAAADMTEPANPPVGWLDFEYVSARVAGNRDAARALLQSFARNHADWQQRFAAAVQSQETESLERMLHTLKGTSGTLGLQRLSEAARDAEQHVREKGSCREQDVELASLCAALGGTLVEIAALDDLRLDI